jgi:hypothetical protein
MEQEKKLPKGITEEMVKDAKEKYGELRVKSAELFVDNDSLEATLSILVLVPTSRIRNEYLKWSEKNPNKAEEIILKACVLTSINQVLADDQLRVAAFDAIVQLLPSGKAVIKNV